ncbi:bifunctional precorrin-2 dehydrogenase/sirohydrochlorin ferrochelatase [Deinococcus sp.]|uniref:precorrin-2 dehydrogenase/sirohydrochlorin ferrochelatase family protein n=1 Tax=Deinococcus sp. TaxID=47478 RepID=UPI002869DF4D|nr:bifunctional precorrin-2 dehydrogenase/sirohydrochlorin ferrochelatase [Deinococcus sp.]
MSLAALLELSGERALIVGGGPVAARRVRTLLEAGLRVHVIAPTLTEELLGLPITHEARCYQPGDAAGAALVVAATDSDAVNDEVVAQTRAAGIPVNHAGHAQRGTLRFPAVTERAGVRVAVTTGRELPMLAQALAEAIARLLPDEPQLNAWTQRREQALDEPGDVRTATLAELRSDIRAHLGLSEAPLGGGA